MPIRRGKKETYYLLIIYTLTIFIITIAISYLPPPPPTSRVVNFASYLSIYLYIISSYCHTINRNLIVSRGTPCGRSYYAIGGHICISASAPAPAPAPWRPVSPSLFFEAPCSGMGRVFLRGREGVRTGPSLVWGLRERRFYQPICPDLSVLYLLLV